MEQTELPKWTKWFAIIFFIILLALPFILNFVLPQPSFCKVIGNELTWLNFWPVYLSAIASLGMIFVTWRTLVQSQRQLEYMKHEQDEKERARLAFSIIVYNYAYFLKVSNVGNRMAYDIRLTVNQEFIEAIEERNRVIFKLLERPFFLDRESPKYFYFGFCSDVKELFKDKNVELIISGSYNGGEYLVNEKVELSEYLAHKFFEVLSERDRCLNSIDKRLKEQNETFDSIQKSLKGILHALPPKESNKPLGE